MMRNTRVIVLALLCTAALFVGAAPARADTPRAEKPRDLSEIRGEVYGCNGPFFGISVYIPGTSFQARVGSDGKFRMQLVLPGSYAVAFERAGIFLRSIPGVRARAGRVVDIGRLTLCGDSDGDGVDMSEDCNDSSAGIRPGATELCNGVDDDCDGEIDEGVNLLTDVSNCGGCGLACASGERCSVGTCDRFPTATKYVRVGGNLDVSSAISGIPDYSSFTALNQTAEISTTVTIIDSVGAPHTVYLYFYHVAPLVFTVLGYVDAGDVGGMSGSPALYGAATIHFTGVGQRIEPSGSDFSGFAAWQSGALLLPVEFIFVPLTSLSQSSYVSGVVSDGLLP